MLPDAQPSGNPPECVSRPGDRQRCPLSDALQLRHNRTPQRGCSYTRQPRLEPAGGSSNAGSSSDDVLVNVLPLFHIHGLSFATHLSLLTGSRMLIADSFHPRHTLELVGQGTVFMAIPTFYYSFLDRPEFKPAARKWGNVRLFTCGSAPIRPEVLPELEEALGRPVINRYGMTESHVITSQPLGGPWPSGSVGLPLEGIEVQVLDDHNTLAPPGLVGSVQLRGPNLFREYWRKPEATQLSRRAGSIPATSVAATRPGS